MKKLAAVALVALLGGAQVAQAQMAPTARSVALGGGGMTFATGVDAIEWNPANLGWAGGWNLVLYEVGAVAASSGAKFDEILAIAGADVLGAGDLNVSQIVNAISGTGLQISTVTEGFLTAYGLDQGDLPSIRSPLPTIGLSIGSIGIRTRSRSYFDLTLSQDLADLIGNGFSLANLQNYAVGNTGFRTTSFSEVNVAYGTTLGGMLSVGVTGRYVSGHGMMNMKAFEPEVDLTTTVPGDRLRIDVVGVEATSGTGYGVDFGASLELPMGFRASAAGTNIYQRMEWDEGLVAHATTFDDFDFDQGIDFIDLIEDRFAATPIDPTSASLAVLTAAEGLFEEAYFPQSYRLGAGWQSGGTTLEATAIKVSPRGRFTSSWDERVAIGIEQKIPLLTLRAGYMRGDDSLSAITGGLALRFGPVHLETSGGKFNSEVGTLSRDGYYATVGLQIKGGGA